MLGGCIREYLYRGGAKLHEGRAVEEVCKGFVPPCGRLREID